MSPPKPIMSRLKLKRYERSGSYKAQILSKINCKIGGHFLNAYVDTGSSISIASNDLYRKLLNDECIFKEGDRALHLVDDSIDEKYGITSTTVTVIGKTKLINLVNFPNIDIKKTILGIDFLSSSMETKLKPKKNIKFEFQTPSLNPNLNSQIKPIQCEQKDKKNQPVTLLDWILNANNLQTPLYNILTEGTATDKDIYEICAFMKRMPRPVSPIRRPQQNKLDILVKKSVEKSVSVPCTFKAVKNTKTTEIR